MQTVVAISNPRDWPLHIPGIQVVPAIEYLTDLRWTQARGVRVFNLCRSYRYQSAGYYVSLLATARRHRTFPSLRTLLDMKSRALVRSVGDEIDTLVQQSLGSIQSDRFTLSVYFGHNVAKRHDRLALRLFNLFPAPLLRAQFARTDSWELASIAPVPAREIPEEHWPFVLEQARQYFARPRYRFTPSKAPRFDLAILHDPKEEFAPSNSKALKHFQAAGEKLGFGVELIQKDDSSRLLEFDALFIRETTAVNHHTFRFAQRAESEGLVVIDDTESILRCSNKVYQAEALELRDVPTPRTLIVGELDAKAVARQIGLPCVLKYPDSSFSQGVVKCKDEDELEQHSKRILSQSDLLLVQEFLPSEFDWRIGILDGKPLYACRYFMAHNHWQIIHKAGGRTRYGKVETLPIEKAPKRVVRTALRAAGAIGDGLYGVDLKQAGQRVVVVEVNDNPNIDAGFEDAHLKGELYERVMRVFLARVEERKSAENGA
jgi:glutathione synthase/RimK-type ligase-like ATP-grasp enzyme